MTYRWGILATGGIAGAMASALQSVDDAEILAVGSRSQESADRFGDKWDIPRRYDTYEALADDPDVDVIYIATPHNLHYENMLYCLNAGKHVLCEKPLTINAKQSAECIALAREKNLFMMEAVWMRFFPAIELLRVWANEGVIGDISMVQADFCFNLPFDPNHRLYALELGGGALLDLGIYPLNFTVMLLGLPDQIEGHARLGRTGADELNAMTLTYENGAMAQLTSSMTQNRPKEAYVIGSKGYIKVHDTFFMPNRLTLHLDGRDPETHDIPYKGNGYAYEVEEVHRCLDDGRIDSTTMPLSETQGIMQLMDTLRARWGLAYPGE